VKKSEILIAKMAKNKWRLKVMELGGFFAQITAIALHS
jgi:hypothetical protein